MLCALILTLLSSDTVDTLHIGILCKELFVYWNYIKIIPMFLLKDFKNSFTFFINCV